MGEPICTVAVIGAGQQGRAFALRCAGAGFATVLEDVMPARLRQAQEELESRHKPVASGRLRLATTVEEAVRDADVAIDFVPDELESKLEIFSMLDRMAPPKTVLCTPTQALSIGDLASCTYRADRCVGLQWAAAPREQSAVTVVTSLATATPVVEQIQNWLQALGLAVTVAQEAPITCCGDFLEGATPRNRV